MPNRKRVNSNRGRSNQRGSRGTTAQNRMVSTLTEIRDLQQVQAKGRVPDVLDIPRIHIARNKVYTFSRTVTAGQITASTTVDQLAALSFTLSSFPNSAEFTSLFDQYRIQYVEVDFIYLNPASVLAPLYSVIDYDDATVPASVNDLLQYGTLMHTSPGQEHVRRLNPKFDYAAYSGAFTSYAVSNFGDWIDVASPSVQYYGVKYALPASATGTAGVVYNISITAILQFRNTR